VSRQFVEEYVVVLGTVLQHLVVVPNQLLFWHLAQVFDLHASYPLNIRRHQMDR